MWQAWVLQLENKDSFMLASELDLNPPIQRMAALMLIDGRIAGTGSSRIAMAAEIAMLRWATNYQPKRNIIRRASKRVAATAVGAGT
jgi:hypothetical protein